MTFSQQVLDLPRPAKRAAALSVDVLFCVLSTYLAYYLRTNAWPDPFGPAVYPVTTSVLLALPIFIISGLYRAIFRYVGAAALIAIVRAAAIYAVPFAFVFTFIGIPGVPRTIGFIQPILLFLFVGGSRSLVGAWLGQTYRDAIANKDRPRILIYGAGASGRQVASALQVSGQVNVLGFLDDDEKLWKATINGKRVHAPKDIERLITRYGVTDVLLAMNKTSRARRSKIISQLTGCGVHIRSMPGVDELASGAVSFSDLKDLEIEDLLGRAPIAPDPELLLRNITGKTVMVTGAGGSIGSEICRQIARLSPATLLLVDSNEFNLYSIDQELVREAAQDTTSALAIVPLLANVRDRRRIDEIISTWSPETIYHAAAYKHVPLVEHNLLEGLANNVLGTLHLALAARDNGVENLVLISTDKAVRPTNAMGATKRLSEIVLQALNAEGSPAKFSMVRFGNVLGSSGSVVPLFRQQIADGGPITITHSDVTRFFMTASEAAQLVIQAGAMAKGGDVFVLDMGEPVRILDLARAMIELSGLRVQEEGVIDGDISIETVGLRPGEKLFEELLIGRNPSPSAHPRILRAHEPFLPWKPLRTQLETLSRMIDEGETIAARNLLKELIVEYEPMDDVVDFVVQKRERLSEQNLLNLQRPLKAS